MDTRTSMELSRREQEKVSRSGRFVTVFMVCFFAGVAVIVVGVAILAYLNVAKEREAHTRFMRQCIQDHKEYECTALWRAGDRPSTDLLVIPIPLPR